MAFINIRYDDGNASDYEAVEIHYGNNEKEIFNSGDFVKDWWYMRKFMIQNLLDAEMYFTHSSSVDHFIMDGAPYDSAYLHTTDEGKPIFKYLDRTDPNFLDSQHEIYEEGIEFFVPEGTQPTFEELKEKYK